MKKLSVWSILTAALLTVTVYGLKAHADSSDNLEPLAPDSKVTASAEPEAENPIPVSDDSAVDAQKIENASHNTDELELNNDVESLEQYGDAASAQTAKSEAARLQKENKQLEHESLLLRHRRELARARAKHLQALYRERAIQAVKVRKKADRAAREAARAQRAVDRLQARLDFKKTLIVRANSREVQALKRIASLKRANRRLQLRLARIKRAIRIREIRLHRLRGFAHSLSQNHRRLAHEIAQAE